ASPSRSSPPPSASSTRAASSTSPAERASSPAPSARPAPSSAPPESPSDSSKRLFVAEDAAVDDDGSVLRGGLEERAAGAVFPHAHGELVAGVYRLGEPGVHRGEVRGVRAAQCVQQCPARHAVGAEPVQDRLREAGELG